MLGAQIPNAKRALVAEQFLPTLPQAEEEKEDDADLMALVQKKRKVVDDAWALSSQESA